MKLDQREFRSEVLDIRIAESIGDGSFRFEFDVTPADGHVLILLEILAGKGDFLLRGVDADNSAAASLGARQRVYVLKPAETEQRVTVGMFAAVNSKVRVTVACFKKKMADATRELSHPLSQALRGLLVSTTLAWMGIRPLNILGGEEVGSVPASVDQVRAFLNGETATGNQSDLLGYLDEELRSAILAVVEETIWLLDIRDQLYVLACQADLCCPTAS